MKHLALAMLLFAACSKSSSDAPKAGPAARVIDPTGKLPDAPADADYIHVSASHAKPKPKDPDVFDIPKFRVVGAHFSDPSNLEGATADLELDLTSLVSNSQNRDDDVKAPDYLGVDQFPTATVHIDNVKKSGDGYTADATIDEHGLTQKMPVEFTVISSTADTIRIHGAHTFQRFAFAIGAPQGQDDSVGPDVTIEMQLTLKKS